MPRKTKVSETKQERRDRLYKERQKKSKEFAQEGYKSLKKVLESGKKGIDAAKSGAESLFDKKKESGVKDYLKEDGDEKKKKVPLEEEDSVREELKKEEPEEKKVVEPPKKKEDEPKPDKEVSVRLKNLRDDLDKLRKEAAKDKNIDKVNKSEFAEQMRIERENYKQVKDNIDKRELVNLLANSLSQLGAAWYGLKTGTDMSNLRLNKIDYERERDRASRESESGIQRVVVGEREAGRKQEKAEDREQRDKETAMKHLADEIDRIQRSNERDLDRLEKKRGKDKTTRDKAAEKAARDRIAAFDQGKGILLSLEKKELTPRQKLDVAKLFKKAGMKDALVKKTMESVETGWFDLALDSEATGESALEAAEGFDPKTALGRGVEAAKEVTQAPSNNVVMLKDKKTGQLRKFDTNTGQFLD